MAHRKWKEIKQQLKPGAAVPGSCLASFHFRWAIHPIRPVHDISGTYMVHIDETREPHTILDDLP